jgi:hypothetical protein
MTRTIDAATITAIGEDNFNLATLIQFDFDSVIRLTDWDRNLSALSTNWVSSPHFMGVSDVSETSDLRVNSLSITLSGVEQTYIAIFLGDDYIDVPAKIYRAVIDSSDDVVGAPILIFDGLIVGYSIDDTEDESKLTVEIASHWKDFEKENGRRTNHNTQQLYFNGDLGFEFAAKTIKDLKWGRK